MLFYDSLWMGLGQNQQQHPAVQTGGVREAIRKKSTFNSDIVQKGGGVSTGIQKL